MKQQMIHLGTEVYYEGRYGTQTRHYYRVGDDIVEERTLTGDKSSYSVTRYGYLSAEDMIAMTELIEKAAEKERKTSVMHNKIEKLLRRYGCAWCYVNLDDIDNPDRKILYSGAMNGYDNSRKVGKDIFEE